MNQTTKYVKLSFFSLLAALSSNFDVSAKTGGGDRAGRTSRCAHTISRHFLEMEAFLSGTVGVTTAPDGTPFSYDSSFRPQAWEPKRAKGQQPKPPVSRKPSRPETPKGSLSQGVVQEMRMQTEWGPRPAEEKFEPLMQDSRGRRAYFPGRSLGLRPGLFIVGLD